MFTSGELIFLAFSMVALKGAQAYCVLRATPILEVDAHTPGKEAVL